MKDRRRRAEPAPLKDLIPGFLKGMSPTKDGLEAVRGAWEEIVGHAAAERTRLTTLESGRLTVLVASAALKHDLSTFRKSEVLSELRRRLPDLRIREVFYRVGSL